MKIDFSPEVVVAQTGITVAPYSGVENGASAPPMPSFLVGSYALVELGATVVHVEDHRVYRQIDDLR